MDQTENEERIIYKKLIRDRIPEIVRAAAKNPYYRTIEGEVLKESIARKIIEEALEICRELLDLLISARFSKGENMDCIVKARKSP